MFKAILFIVILFVAYGLVVIMLRRLTQTSRQLSDLHEQMARNDAKLSEQLRALNIEQERARLEAEKNKNAR
jgi:predicted Holliday junction resolvase-like endonuclease